MVGLLVIELLEELGGEGGVFSNKHVELMVGRCRGVDRWVGVFGHSLSVVDAEGVSAEGSVGLAVFKGLRFLSAFVVL